VARAVAAVHASDHASRGHSDQTVTLGPGPDACGWQYAGVQPPYYGGLLAYVGQNYIEVTIQVSGPFTVGY
jgi:hypothetical protein